MSQLKTFNAKIDFEDKVLLTKEPLPYYYSQKVIIANAKNFQVVPVLF